MLELYTYFRSSAAYRVRIALNLKGLEYQPHVIRLPEGEQDRDAYRAVNPQALVPTLVDGGVRLSQSLAIVEYLEETRPNPPLLPRDPVARARSRSLALLVACDVHPLNNLRVLRYLKQELGQAQPVIDTWYRHWCALALTAYERELERGSGRFSVGDAVSIADLCLIPQLFNARRFELDLSAYPTVLRVEEACVALDAFERAHPAKQPDAR